MTTEADIARLKAEALAAQAEAAAAKAAAAQAALDAAMAATQTPQPAQEPVAEEPRNLSDYGTHLKDAYASSPNHLTIGTYIEDGEPQPGVNITLPIGMLNRHGLIAGATGTGKTRTLQLLAEGLSAAGVPVFLTDIKGDLTGLLEAGTESEKLIARTTKQGQTWSPRAYPTELYTLGGEGNGTPIRTTVSDFGPILLSKVLGLNNTQESALSLIFHWADQERLALIDLNDVRAVATYLTSDDGKKELATIGGISSATAGVILREIAELQAQGADAFFGEPAFDVSEFIRTTADGRGVISALELPDVYSRPALFSTFVMWLLAELFEILPERGDADVPKLVFFFDEAHLLFNGASPEFLNQVVQTVRLIRSKGVGIFFVTQTPKDVPDDVLGQLGAKIQHALRAHTPQDAKALRETVKTFPNSPLDLEKLLPSLGTGEAIVTILDSKGRPSPVAPTRIWAPSASMGVASDSAIKAALNASLSMAKYKDVVDPESAYELLEARMEAERLAKVKAQAEAAAQKEAEKLAREQAKEQDRLARELEKQIAAEERAAKREQERLAREAEKEAERAAKRRDSIFDSVIKTAGRTLAREITRGLFGTRRK